MAKCAFYQVHLHPAVPKPEAAPNPAAWCSHSQSPVSIVLATQTVGEAQKLKCGGDLAKCQIAPEFRPPSWLA